MPSNALPSSTLELTSLQPSDTPSLIDLRPFLEVLRDQNAAAAFTLVQQALDVIQETLRSSSPYLKYLSVGSADIADLTVSGEFGPGSFQILNGPPNYDQIGWMGSQANAASVNITSIVAGLVTTAAPHELKIGDNVYIESTTAASNTGYYVVLTVPLATTFTVTGGIPGGNSTGGTMTKQFQGMWVKTFAAGGTAFDNAPFIVDVDGSVTITNAAIVINGSGADIVIDPVTGTIVVTEAGGGRRVTIGGLGITLDDSTGSPSNTMTLTPEAFQMNSNDVNAYQINLTANAGMSIFAPTTSFTLSKLIDIYGYSGATSNGPVLSCTQLRGTGQTTTATQSGDTLGGVVVYGFDGTGESNYAAGVRGEATEAHTITAHGAKLVFEVTPNSTASTASPMTLEQDGKLTVTGDAVTVQHTIASASQPTVVIDNGGSTKVRLGRVVATNRGDFSVNLYFDGTNWNLDDTTLAGVVAVLSGGTFTAKEATAGANPRTLVDIFSAAAAAFNVPASYQVNGTQVVGARGAALTAAVAYGGGIFGATYTGAEQTLANALVTQVTNLKTRVDQLEARLNAATGHGLIA